ncbi:MAG: ArnT family glycosyltransferase [Acidobacteriota bacterium]
MAARWSVLVLILLVAFGLRAGFVLYRHLADPGAGRIVDIRGHNDDQVEFDTTARNILRGRGFWSSDRGGVPYASEPGYPLFLAGVYAVTGGSVLMAELLQAVLGTISCLLLYRIGRDLFDARSGYVAAALLAIHPNHVYYSAFILGATLKVFVILWMISTVIQAVTVRKLRPAILAGCALGAAIMTRIVVLPYLFMVTLVIGFSRTDTRRRSLHAAAFFLTALAVLLPWSIRNYRVTGVLTVFHPASARMLAISSDAYTAERLKDEPGYKNRREKGLSEETRRVGEEIEGGSTFREFCTALQLWGKRILQTPGEMFRLLSSRFMEFWKLYPRGGRFARPLLQTYSLILNGGIFGFFIWGLFRASLAPRVRLLLVLIVVTFLGVHLLYETVPMRYRMPIEPVLILLAVGGMKPLRLKRAGRAPAAVSI